MEGPVARAGGVPGDDVGSTPGLVARPLSPDALEAHVQAACDALRSGGTFGVLDLRGHPDAGVVSWKSFGGFDKNEVDIIAPMTIFPSAQACGSLSHARDTRKTHVRAHSSALT